MTKKLLLALFLIFAPFGAVRACPVVNSYPFTAGCPLTADQLNAAIANLYYNKAEIANLYYNTVSVNAANGLTNTLGSLRTSRTVVNWTGNTLGIRTQYIPGCTATLANYIIFVKDTSFVASPTNYYLIVPLSGTVELASNAIMNSPGESAHLVCDGGTNWVWIQ